ncbi:SDR family NAD(P)-dependent oxidoreductase [Thalassotalea nanhaiensis]|uniref:SDR family NAD(P)-dependent oxidoreductase n=1 Tax=Thalassotalea nanhaiensis TaxID=3065648 RepID=A0ABY9TR75_9GAMM|nr:SDR family NAD(P)-dependent oxidoreductase [Colwelliaceae bacterium SQ345]
MKNQFYNKVCLVTGSASGIGKAVTQLLSSRGARVVAVDINITQLQQWVDSSNNNITVKRLNVIEHEDFSQLIKEIITEFGQLDYLFNIAGITVAGEVVNLTIEHWKKVLSVDLDGVVNGSTLAFKQMAKQGGGHIINLASIQGLVPLPMEAPYVTAKFGVVGLSQALRVEGADLGVKVSVVCPGYVKTPIFEKSEMMNLDRDKHLKSLEGFEKSGISPEGCAEVILAGVKKNKAIIPVTTPAKFLWMLSRLSPSFLIKLLTKDLAKSRLNR